jgi:hypothetical protein
MVVFSIDILLQEQSEQSVLRVVGSCCIYLSLDLCGLGSESGANTAVTLDPTFPIAVICTLCQQPAASGL